ncbi:MAG: type II toxin-antitoxin system RelE/ParE family toxin [Hyphomonadaceae bacterium]|nr:type II toxin-antitoxin system RelE/ParE family toxin [Hyphomonadaceae bacterium]
MHAVIETHVYLRAAEREGMTEEEKVLAVDTIARDPMAGDLIVGGGGCRKIRIAGKSGGYRIVTYYAEKDVPVFLVSVLSKGSRGNFSKAERNAMAVAAKSLAEGIA